MRIGAGRYKYNLEDELGCGAQGRVYKGIDTVSSLSSNFCLKSNYCIVNALNYMQVHSQL